MQQIVRDTYSVSEVDDFKNLVVCIEYFSKRPKAKLIKDKSATTMD